MTAVAVAEATVNLVAVERAMTKEVVADEIAVKGAGVVVTAGIVTIEETTMNA